MAGTGDGSTSDGTERLREWLAGGREWLRGQLLDVATGAVPGGQPRDVAGSAPEPAGPVGEQWIAVAVELPLPAGVDAPTAMHAMAKRLLVGQWWPADIQHEDGAPTLRASREDMQITVRWAGERFLLFGSSVPVRAARSIGRPGGWLGRRDVLLLQDNADRRQIFSLVTGDGPARANGPLRYSRGKPVPAEKSPEELASWLLERRDELHDLADYFHFYNYPADVVAWIEATPVVAARAWGFDDREAGRSIEEVASRLGLNVKALDDAAGNEAWMEGSYDPAGDPRYHLSFSGNWAMGEAMYVAPRINPDALRFKQWLSLEC